MAFLIFKNLFMERTWPKKLNDLFKGKKKKLLVNWYDYNYQKILDACKQNKAYETYRLIQTRVFRTPEDRKLCDEISSIMKLMYIEEPNVAF